MTDLVPQPVTPAVGGDSYRLWEKDRQRVEQDIVAGLPFDAFLRGRGGFDAMFGFMLQGGLGTAATQMRPSGLKKDNGVPHRLLNGLAGFGGVVGVDTPGN